MNHFGSVFKKHWWYTTKGEIRREEICMDYFGEKLMPFWCHGAKGNQEFIYNDTVRVHSAL